MLSDDQLLTLKKTMKNPKIGKSTLYNREDIKSTVDMPV